MQVIVLGSTSKYRAKLLSRLQLPFISAKPICDETPLPGELPEALASRLSQIKARSLKNQYLNDIIIGSDQVAAVGGSILGKPGTNANARLQLQAMRGQPVVFYTALSVLDCASENCLNAMDKTVATLRDLSDDEIDRYLAAESPLDCAGSFMVEKLGISLFESVETSDPTALIGMPLIKLSQCLRQLGVAVP